MWPPSLLVCLVQNGAKVGQKRARDPEWDELAHYDDGQPRKKSRNGWPAQQWITVYNKHAAMKQR